MAILQPGGLPTLKKGQWFVSFNMNFIVRRVSPFGIFLIKDFRLDPKMSSLNINIHVMVRFQYIF